MSDHLLSGTLSLANAVHKHTKIPKTFKKSAHRYGAQVKDSDKFFKQLLSAVEKTAGFLIKPSCMRHRGLDHTHNDLACIGPDVFCGNICRVVRNLAVPYSTPVLSSERGAFCRGNCSVPVNQCPPSVR